MAVEQGFGAAQQVLPGIAEGLPDLLGQFAVAVRIVLAGRGFGCARGGRRVLGFAHAHDAEHVAERLRHEFAVRGQRAFEVFGAHAQRRGQVGALRRIARQQMGLRVLAVLQGMFGAPQVAVSFLQAPGVLLGHQARDAFRMQRFQQAALLQGGHAAAADQLGKLHHEFNLADAAVAQLDVVRAVDAAARLGAPLPVLADAFSQGAQGGQGIEIEILAVDEGHAQAFQLPRLGGAIAAFERLGRHQPRLEPRITFPFAALADQVVLQRVQAPCQGAGIAIGAQPQVGPEDLPVGVHFRQHGHHAPRQAAVELVVADAARAVGLAFLAVQHDQVDVGGHVQFAAAELAHAHDQHFLRFAGGGVPGHAVDGGQVGRHAAVRRGHGGIGQRGHGAHDFLERGVASQVAHDESVEDAFA
ncbi:hypothetical protein D9M68_495070 [compost metagenome]